MKKLILFTMLVIFSLSNAQNNTFPTPSGNVGIGTTTPSSKLHISSANPILNIENVGAWNQGNGGMINFSHFQDNLSSTLAQIKSSLVDGSVLSRKGDLKFFTTNDAVSAQKMIIKYDGNIGIGTNFPQSIIQIGSQSSVNANNYFSFGKRIASTQGNMPFIGQDSFDGVGNDLGFGTRSSNGAINFYTGNNTVFNPNNIRMRITNNGNVGIGTNNFTQDDAKLLVEGKILCEEVEVIQDVLPDYVFQKYYTGFSSLKTDYTMPTLEEIEIFTKANHHLPEVPSAKEVKENGMQLKEMTTILLQKVEELTLYTIEQEKRIKVLEAKLTQKK